MNQPELEDTLQRLTRQILYSLNRSNQNVDSSPIVKLINVILTQAIDVHATDIHIEPQRHNLRIRYRLDGILSELHKPFDAAITQTLISRLKIMSNMDTTTHQVPLDGHIDYEYNGRKIDMRVASIPIKYGETIVIRLMDVSENLQNISELGMSTETEKTFRQLIHSPSGMFIVTGPMNSGKSTSLYAALRELNTGEQHIMTLEDPIEQFVDGVNQMEVVEKTGLTFASGLRSMLRMDCNCIMVGEARDTETAQIAVRAALTGHLILTTLHAKDSCSAIFRLLEMNVEPYLLAATLTGVMSQRLVRRICPHCKQSYEVAANSVEAALLGKFFSSGMKLYRGVGCEHCRHTGFNGRIAIHEILEVDETIRKLILNFNDVEALRRIALDKHFVTMFEDGILKVIAGLTTINEINKVL
ncbi:MAG: type II/IV secretion system protein [Selenomonadaceae bacterium]|nr:type II/IV secretion system protein [Selenomonadaceae bacterium]